jgi:hypothetical protein
MSPKQNDDPCQHHLTQYLAISRPEGAKDDNLPRLLFPIKTLARCQKVLNFMMFIQYPCITYFP